MTATQRDRYLDVRRRSERFCEPLAVEDYGLQAMASTSPAKWHLAHTAWFFETFLLKPYAARYQSPQPQFEQLFNSYYNGIGQPFARDRRGLLSRPTLAEVYQYRAAVDDAMQALISAPPAQHAAAIANRVELGLHHEQQHQELFFTDLKYCFAQNPLYPRYHSTTPPAATAVTPLTWWQHPGGQVQIGNRGQGFAFDNETPAHPVLLQPFALANRLVSNAEFLQFIADGGYQRPELWLADGWQVVQDQGWQHPLYWRREAGDAMNPGNPEENDWQEYRLAGLQPLEPAAPVCHLSAYEADAYARWAGARLPTEFEWEAAAQQQAVAGHFVDSGHLHPGPATGEPLSQQLNQLYGDVWEWTASSYAPYPGFRASPDTIGEYNGKFMCNQWVLRGGSCVSSADHLRSSYRNFFYPPDRWQFSGLRLARDIDARADTHHNGM